MSQNVLSEENIYAPNPHNAYPEYDHIDNPQGPSEGEGIEMTAIQPQGTVHLIPPPWDQTTAANRLNQEMNEVRRNQGADSGTGPGSRQKGNKRQMESWMTYLNTAGLESTERVSLLYIGRICRD